MTTLLIQNATLILPDQISLGGCLVKDGVIAALFDRPFPEGIQAKTNIDAAGNYLAPGLIDLQLNGAFGHDFTQSPETMWSVAARLPELGLTGFLPTIITSPLAQSNQAQQVLKRWPPGFAGTIPLGLHLEGPFLNPQKKGAHNPNHILSAAEAPAREMADWSAENGVRLVTLAPELAGAIPLIKRLVSQGVVVSAGHSMATLAEAQAGFAAGISYVTHLFNAMPPLHHREPGLVAAALANPSITIGIIPDGVHVHPDLVELVWQLAGGRVNGVTDAMGAMGGGPGQYLLGDFTVTVTETDARLPDGTLAGSVVRPMQVMQNLVEYTGCSVAEAIRSMTAIPADLLGVEKRKGRLEVGLDADLIVFDGAFNLEKTIIQGHIVYDRK